MVLQSMRNIILSYPRSGDPTKPSYTRKLFSHKTQQTTSIRMQKEINTPPPLQKKSSPPTFRCFLGVAPYQAAGVLTCLFYCLFWIVGCQSPSGVPENIQKTSHDLGPKKMLVKSKGNGTFQGNLGW